MIVDNWIGLLPQRWARRAADPLIRRLGWAVWGRLPAYLTNVIAGTERLDRHTGPSCCCQATLSGVAPLAPKAPARCLK